MRTDFYYDSCGGGRIHGCRWTPNGPVEAVVQIIHGIAERVERYDEFAQYLNERGILVVAEDHMGHGQSVEEDGTLGFFEGGWNAAVDDSYHLLETTRAEFPEQPYLLFGHSMGSFMTRSLLIRYPDSGITHAVICGTGWISAPMLSVGLSVARSTAKRIGEKTPSEKLHKLVFGGYNKRVEHPRTEFDWLSRDCRIVDEYIADPLCGFMETSGLLRDMLGGMAFNQKKSNLERMDKELPVLFIAGGDDPVGNYGSGVRQCAQSFRDSGMKKVECRIFPLGRHEILNEINREEIYDTVYHWFKKMCG